MPAKLSNFDTKKERDQFILDEHQSGRTGDSIAEDVAIGPAMVHRIIKDAGISRPVSYRKYDVNEDFFSHIDDERSAYVLGLLTADGCVQENWVSIELHERDAYLVKLVREALGSTHPLVRTDGRNSVMLQVSSRALVQGAMDIGLMPRKSGWEEYIEVVPELERHYIRGLFDGDGHVSFRPEHSGAHEWNLLSSRKVMEGVRAFFEDQGIEGAKTKDHYSDGLMYLVYYRRESIKRIYKALYEGAEHYMMRKRDIFEEIRSHGWETKMGVKRWS